MMTAKRLKPYIFIAVLCTLFVASAAFFITRWYDAQLNPDATSYITIAQKYARGEFGAALNGYWGPLLSVLMVPFLWMGIAGIVAAKLVSACAVAGILFVVHQFLHKRSVSRLITYGACIALAAIMLGWVTYEPITPDVLIAFFVVLFATKLVEFIKAPSRNQAMLLGLIGALMYFSKGFGFFLFIGVVGVVALWQWIRVDKKFLVVFKRFLPLAIVFLVLVIPFITLISFKYKHFTINNAGDYDFRVYGFHGTNGGNIPPANNITSLFKPFAPPNDSAISGWEDPVEMTKSVKSWSPIGSAEEFSYFIDKVLVKNLTDVFTYIYARGPFTVISVVVLATAWLQRKRFQIEYSLFAVVSALMLIGYSLILAEGRYLWAAFILGTAAAALCLDVVYKKQLLNRVQLIAGSLLLIGATGFSTWETLIAARHADGQWRDVSYGLRDHIPTGTNIISDNFFKSYQTCYYLRLHCYNVISTQIPDFAEYYNMLKTAGVEMYVDYHTRPGEPTLDAFVATHFTPLGHAKIGNQPVTIYRLK